MLKSIHTLVSPTFEGYLLEFESSMSVSFVSEYSRKWGKLKNGIYCQVTADILTKLLPGRVAQSVGHLTRKSEVLGLIPGLARYFRFSFRFFKKGNCQLLAKVCARSTG